MDYSSCKLIFTISGLIAKLAFKNKNLIKYFIKYYRKVTEENMSLFISLFGPWIDTFTGALGRLHRKQKHLENM